MVQPDCLCFFCHTSAMSAAHHHQAAASVTTVKPPLVDSPNKGHLKLSGQQNNRTFQYKRPPKNVKGQHRVHQCVRY